MKKKRELMLVISVLLLTIFYFTYSVTITWDSAHYMSYVNILEGMLPFTSWDVVRGPVFPIIIYLSNILFGETVQGLLINSYIYYLLMLLFSYKILDEILPDNKWKNKIILFTLILIILNPIIYGYYHVLLTEFVAMTLAVLTCYLVYKWLNCDFTSKKKFILYLLLFSFLTVFGWFLKQPYISTTFFPLVIAFIIVMFRKEKRMKKILSAITLVFCGIVLVLSINLWNGILEYKGVDVDTSRNPTTSLGNSLVEGLRYFELDSCEIECDIDTINSDKYLSKEEKEDIIDLIDKNDDTFIIVSMYNEDDEIIDKDFVDTDGNNLSIFDSLGVILSNFVKHPLLIIDAYISNYLSIANIYGTTNENSMHYESTGKISLKFVNEISSIGMKPYSYTSNIFYITDEAYERVVNYEQFNHAPKLINYTMILLGKVSMVLFKIIFLLLPIMLVVSIVNRLRRKDKKYDMLIILFGYGFLHMLLHTVTGAIIDRYAMPAYITTFLGMIMLVFLYRKKEVK